MDQETLTHNEAPVHVPTGAPSAAPAEPSDYQDLKRFYDDYAPVLQRLAPVWDDVQPIVEDEDQRKYWKAAREARQRQLEAQEPQYTPELKRLRDEFAGTISEVSDWVKSQKQERERTTLETQARAAQANLDYAQRLVAERPEFAEENYATIAALASLAQRDGSSLEESFKRYGSRFAGPAPKREPPPSLRAGAAAPGIPGESTREKPRGKVAMQKMLADRIRAGMKG